MNFWKKTGQTALAISPFFIATVVQFILIIPFIGITFAYSVMRCSTKGMSDMNFIMEYANGIWSSINFNSWFYIVFSISLIYLFGYWYFCKFEKFTLNPKKLIAKLHPLAFLGIIILAIGLQYIAMYAINFTAAINPDWLTAFESMEDSLEMDDMTFGLALYAVILAPINEELIFRGVSLHYAKRAMPFWIANILQALLFGIYHMNMIQGVYTFFVGLFLGYVCENCGGILASILLHIIYNFFASYGSSIFFYGESSIMYCFWLCFAVLFPILGIFFCKKGSIIKNRS